LTAEALIWWTDSPDASAFATTSSTGTQQANAGRLDQPGTRTLFGNDGLLDGPVPGFRIRGGHSIDCGTGIDFEYLQLASQNDSFFSGSTGDPILARPFFNPNTNQQDAQLIGFPGVATGSLRVDLESRFYSGAIHLYSIADEEPTCGECSSLSAIMQIGPRFASLNEDVLTNEYVTGLSNGTQNRIIDSFQTRNSFLGAELGVKLQKRTNQFFWRGGLSLALGATHQELDVSGRTIRTDAAGVRSTYDGGFLAQRTNSGSSRRNRFSVLPQAELTLGYETRWGWDLTVGYNLLYWSNVLRAAEQIDTTVNPNLFPPEVVPFSGDHRPQTLLSESGYLAHGISIGIEKQW